MTYNRWPTVWGIIENMIRVTTPGNINVTMTPSLLHIILLSICRSRPKEYKYPSSLTNLFLYLWILYAVIVGVVWVTREEELTCLYCWVNFVLCCVTPWRGAEPPVKYKQCSGTECTARPDGRSINYELYFTYLSW